MKLSKRTFLKTIASFIVAPKLFITGKTPDRIEYETIATGEPTNNARVKALAQSMRLTKQRVAARILNNAFTP